MIAVSISTVTGLISGTVLELLKDGGGASFSNEAITQGSNTQGGRLDIIQADGDFAFISGQQHLITDRV